MKKIVLVANDISPSQAFTLLSEALSKAGWVVTGFLGMGKLDTHDAVIAEAIQGASLVLAGMSSTPALAEKELAAVASARAADVPFGFFADGLGCFRREHFRHLAELASVLFVASEAEREEAQALYLIAQVAVTGNPSWEGFENPSLTDDDIRRAIGAKESDRIVLVPLNKARPASLDVAIQCLRGHSSADGVHNVLVVIAPHPGAAKKNPSEPAEYEEALRISFGGSTCALPRYVVLREKEMGIKSQDVLRVADYVLSAQATTTDLQAVFLRVPVFNYLEHPETKARLLSEIGVAVPPLCELRAALQVQDPTELFFLNNLQRVVEGQVKAFPYGAPPVGSAISRILAVLTK